MPRRRIDIQGPPDEAYTDHLMTAQEREVHRRVRVEVYGPPAGPEPRSAPEPTDGAPASSLGSGTGGEGGAADGAAPVSGSIAGKVHRLRKTPEAAAARAAIEAPPEAAPPPAPGEDGETTIWLRVQPPAEQVRRIEAQLGDRFRVEDVLLAAFRAARNRLATAPLEDWVAPDPRRRRGPRAIRFGLTLPDSTIRALKAKIDPLDIRPLTYLVQGRVERALAAELDALVDRLAATP